jgi:hypothetical protein
MRGLSRWVMRFDDAALAGGVAALEQNHQLELLMDDPVLKFDEFLLQPQQLLEIDVAIECLVRGLVAGMLQQPG